MLRFATMPPFSRRQPARYANISLRHAADYYYCLPRRHYAFAMPRRRERTPLLRYHIHRFARFSRCYAAATHIISPMPPFADGAMPRHWLASRRHMLFDDARRRLL